MKKTQEEQYGKLALTNILASIWLGDWDRYEGIFQNMEQDLKETFPFHSSYRREEVKLWHENYFFIPGDYFVSPYFSSYQQKQGDDGEERKKNLLCLIGIYERMGFYFPVEQELYPDHLGCLTTFLSSLLMEQIKAEEKADFELVNQLESLEADIVTNYMLPLIEAMQENAKGKIKHPFFNEFLPYHYEVLREEFTAV